MELVFRDLLQALSGKQLAPLQLPPSIDDLLGPDFGDLKIVSLWGPLSLGALEEQTIGIATINGSITITVASLHPLNSLLPIAEQELKEACS